MSKGKECMPLSRSQSQSSSEPYMYIPVNDKSSLYNNVVFDYNHYWFFHVHCKLTVHILKTSRIKLQFLKSSFKIPTPLTYSRGGIHSNTVFQYVIAHPKRTLAQPPLSWQCQWVLPTCSFSVCTSWHLFNCLEYKEIVPLLLLIHLNQLILSRGRAEVDKGLIWSNFLTSVSHIDYIIAMETNKLLCGSWNRYIFASLSSLREAHVTWFFNMIIVCMLKNIWGKWKYYYDGHMLKSLILC